MSSSLQSLCIALLVVPTLSCGPAGPPPAPSELEERVDPTLPVAVIDAGFPDGRRYYPQVDIQQIAQLPEGADIQAWEVGRDAQASHHVVAVRTAEKPHAHLEHEIVVMIVSGHGKMLMDREEFPVGEGSLLYVPRGTLHAFTNQGEEPAIAYVIYTPPEDGNDHFVPQ